LSDDVLLEVAGPKGAAGNSSGGSATRTQPSNEHLTVSAGPKNHQRAKLSSSEIRDAFEGEGKIQGSVEHLVLFPTGTERNLSENWWIPGEHGDDGAIAVANCNKSTYEYLSDLQQVWHVDDYIAQAKDVKVVTTDGKKLLGDIDELIVYTLSDSAFEMFNDAHVLENLSEVLAEAAASKYKGPQLSGDETIILLPESQAFEARPILKDAEITLSGGTDLRNIGTEAVIDRENYANIGAHMVIYGKTRLGEWDWNSPELSAIDDSIMVSVDEGGYELIETLAKLHDNGEPLFSEDGDK
jgi:hypothetical protein